MFQKDSVLCRRRLGDAAWILQALPPAESAQLPGGFILLSTLALVDPDISNRQELPILFLLCLHEPTTIRNQGTQDLLCKLFSSAARNTIKGKLEKFLLLVSFKRLTKCSFLMNLQKDITWFFTHSQLLSISFWFNPCLGALSVDHRFPC